MGTLRADGGDIGGGVRTLLCSEKAYGFKPQQGEKANGIGFEEEIAPTLSAAVSYAGGILRVKFSSSTHTSTADLEKATFQERSLSQIANELEGVHRYV